MTWERVRAARARFAAEEGTICKDWGGKLPVALVYPNAYRLGMSNLGIHAIYAFLNSRPDVVCERVFWEGREKDTGQPPVSIESQRPLTDFAVVAFSVTYELDYLNLPAILAASSLPLYAAQRDETHPLIIAGGACITANPMPVAPFFDCLFIGEAEAILPRLLELIEQERGSKRDTLLSVLSKMPGAYVPLYAGQVVQRQWTEDVDAFPVHSAVLTRDTELGDMYLLEVERGCRWACRFCLVCGMFRPMRARSLDSLVAQAEIGLKYRRRVGLVGPDVPDHPQFEQLLTRLKQMGAETSVSSLRVRPLSSLALSELARSGSGTVALAPEAGSQRLRDVIRKGIGEDDIVNAMHVISREKMKQVRLYFMIGLPTETDDDIGEIASLTLKCASALEQKRSGVRITLSVAPFVPKAGTPFEWMPMERVAVLERRLARLKVRLQPEGVKVVGESPAWSQVQAVLARGDSRLAPAMAGMRELSLPAWRRSLEESDLDAERYAHRKWDTNEELPWAKIDSGRSLDYLKQELERALREQ